MSATFSLQHTDKGAAYVDMATITLWLSVTVLSNAVHKFFFSDKEALETTAICREMRLINTQISLREHHAEYR